jgi:cytochrome c oxidase assembly factor 5
MSTEAEPRRKCDGLRYDLKLCLLESDCCKKFHTIPKNCLRDPEMAEHVPDRCWSLVNAFFECKRSTIDMRYRFKGAKGY